MVRSEWSFIGLQWWQCSDFQNDNDRNNYNWVVKNNNVIQVAAEYKRIIDPTPVNHLSHTATTAISGRWLQPRNG